MEIGYRGDQLTERIIQCIVKVHQALGPGFLEKVYRRALLVEFRRQGLLAETEKIVRIYYDGHEVGRHRLDFVVEGDVVVETKTVERLSKVHYAQVRSYLKATGLEVAILVNFSEDLADFRRIEFR